MSKLFKISHAAMLVAGLALTAPIAARAADTAAYDEAVRKSEKTLDDYGSAAVREEFYEMQDDVDLKEKGLLDGHPPSDDGVTSVILLVEKSKQTVKIKVNGQIVDTWKVSTGRPGHSTPDFVNLPVLKMVPDYWSHKYNAPMPYSIFITDAIALHATTPDQYGNLGSVASHGCIRQTLTEAKALYNFVKKHRAQTRIYVIR